MSVPEKNSLAAAAEIVATLSNLSEAQGASSKDEADIKSILNAVSGINDPQEMKRILTNFASIKGLSDSVRNCVDILLSKLNTAEKAAKSSPGDENVRKIKECVNTILSKLQSENSQALTGCRIQLNQWTQAQNAVDSTAKAILQI